MQTRFWLFALAFGCVLLIVQATEEAATSEAATEEKVAVPIAAEEDSLEARYPGGSSRGGEGWNSGHKNGGHSKGGRGNSGRGKSGWNGGNGRRGDSNNDSSDNGNGRGHSGHGGVHGGGNGNSGIDQLTGHGRRNKVINLGTRNLGTKRTYSGSRKVVSSRKDYYFNKNFVNTVVENLKTVRKVVHTDTKILVKKPLTVDNLKVHQQTNYVKNIYPHLEKVWIERYGEVIKPAHLTQVSRSASASKRTIRHRLQVSSKSRSENLGVKYERTQNLGVNNIGNQGIFNDNDSSDSSNNNRNNNRGHNGGNNRRNRGGNHSGNRNSGHRGNKRNNNSNNGCRGEYC